MGSEARWSEPTTASSLMCVWGRQGTPSTDGSSSKPFPLAGVQAWDTQKWKHLFRRHAKWSPSRNNKKGGNCANTSGENGSGGGCWGGEENVTQMALISFKACISSLTLHVFNKHLAFPGWKLLAKLLMDAQTTVLYTLHFPTSSSGFLQCPSLKKYAKLCYVFSFWGFQL